MTGFKITNKKGFHITFENGFTVSVQFGPSNYIEEHQEYHFMYGGDYHIIAKELDELPKVILEAFVN